MILLSVKALYFGFLYLNQKWSFSDMMLINDVETQECEFWFGNVFVYVSMVVSGQLVSGQSRPFSDKSF